MAASKQVGGDGAFIDPDDLERAAKAMKAANIGVKAAERYSRRKARKSLPWRRRLSDAAKGLLLFAYLAFGFGIFIIGFAFAMHGAIWLVDHTLGELWRYGWDVWTL